MLLICTSDYFFVLSFFLSNRFNFLAALCRVMSEVKKRFKPSIVVCQCGVDTLAGDPMASFNLTQYSIGECVKYLMEWNLPLLLLGGGRSSGWFEV